MEKRINVAELLKDCSKGMELDCTMFVNPVYLNEVLIGDKYSIAIETKNGDIITLTDYGAYADIEDAKCVIFPKDETTWEGFQRPFKDGDILCNSKTGQPFILKFFDLLNNNVHSYCGINAGHEFCKSSNYWTFASNVRFATEREKQKLFDAIKDNGYEWNAETKTLKKLIKPRFNVGEVIQDTDSYKVKITEVNIEDECYGYESVIAKGIGSIKFDEQDNWELAPNKFDINTLVPFESKVLIRNDETQKWIPAFWGYKPKHNYVTTFGVCNYCIPYEGNENLLSTNNDCDDFYKTWNNEV